jgi:Ribbon-helix-helix protein, copG family
MSAKPKKMGRPPKPGGQDVLVAGRVPRSTAAKLAALAKKYKINRSEALRRVIEASVFIANSELPLQAKAKARKAG